MLHVLVIAAALVAAPGGMAVASQSQIPHSTEESPAAPGEPQESPAAPGELTGDADPADAAPGVPGNVSGVYRCEGTNPDGSLYEGLVEIAAIDDTYLVHWVMANGSQVLGVGILRGGVLAVSYFGGTPAVAVYRVDGERLVGEWTMGGAEGMLYSETLTRMRMRPRQPQAPIPGAPSPRAPARPAPPANARPVQGVTAI